MNLYPELTGKILKALFEVQNQLGSDYQEKYYQHAIEIELQQQKIPYERERKIPVFYKQSKIGYHSFDFVVDGLVVAELKTKPKLTEKDINQLLSYMNYL